MSEQHDRSSEQDAKERLERGLTKDSVDVLRTLLETMPIIVWEIDMAGTFVLSEGQALSLLGLSPGQVVGMNVFEAFASEPGSLVPIRAALDGIAGAATITVGEAVFDGLYVPVRDAEGRQIGVRGFARDVTEREKSAAALRERLAQIEEQKDAIRVMGTPIIKVWHDVVAVPIIGRIDEERAALMMKGLLDSVVEGQARHAILDLTGVESMDQKTAEQIGGMMSAVRLLGAQGILTGMRPQVAQSMVSIDVDLSHTRILRDLCEAIQFCMKNEASAKPKAGKAR